MALAGITVVGEFHYLHHDPAGKPYADPNAMGKALIQAAHEAGIRLTLLDTCYLAGGLTGEGHVALDEVQRRFSDGDVDTWAARVAALRVRPHDPARRRGALGACRPPRRPRRDGRGDPWPGRARPRERAARREPRGPDVLWRHPDPAARGRRPAQRALHRRARHPPHRRRRRTAGREPGAPPASARRPSATWPTASAPRTTSSRPAPGSRSARTSTPSSTRSRRCAGSRCTSAW